MRGHSWIILYFLNSLRPIFFGLVDCLFSWLSTTDLFFFFALLDLFLTLHNFFFFFCLPVSSLHDGFFLVSLALFLTLHSIFFSFFLILLFCLPFSSLHDNFSYRFPKYLRRIFLLSFVDRFLSMTAFSFFSLSLFCWLVHHHPIVFMALHPPPAWTRRGCQVLLTWPRSEETNL